MPLTDKRVLLIGGKGGVGKTTMASSLALLAAKRGKRTLVVSTDPAHSLADAFDQEIGDQPVTLAEGLDGMEIDPDHEVAAHIGRVTRELKRFTRPEMFAEIERQMRVSQQAPGAQEAALLERIARIIDESIDESSGDDSARYDLVIFDTAPTGHTLRLLTLPEAMAAWTQGLLKHDSRSKELAGVLDHLTPKKGKDIDNPMAEPAQLATAEMNERSQQLTDRLLERQRLFQRTRRVLMDGKQAGLLFVLTPEKLPVLETARAVKVLQAEKLPLEGLIINRILPASADGEFLAQRRTQEAKHLAEIEQLFSRFKRFPIELQPIDIHGTAALDDMAVRLEKAGF